MRDTDTKLGGCEDGAKGVACVVRAAASTEAKRNCAHPEGGGIGGRGGGRAGKRGRGVGVGGGYSERNRSDGLGQPSTP